MSRGGGVRGASGASNVLVSDPASGSRGIRFLRILFCFILFFLTLSVTHVGCISQFTRFSKKDDKGEGA